MIFLIFDSININYVRYSLGKNLLSIKLIFLIKLKQILYYLLILNSLIPFIENQNFYIEGQKVLAKGLVNISTQLNEHQMINHSFLEDIHNTIVKKKKSKRLKILPLLNGINKKDFGVIFANTGLNSKVPLKK